MLQYNDKQKEQIKQLINTNISNIDGRTARLRRALIKGVDISMFLDGNEFSVLQEDVILTAMEEGLDYKVLMDKGYSDERMHIAYLALKNGLDPSSILDRNVCRYADME